MLIGRFICGMCGETIVVATSTIYATWFKGQEYLMALGINYSAIRLVGYINGPLMEYIAEKHAVGFCFVNL